MIGQTLHPFLAQVTIIMGASMSGWGAHMGSLTASRLWPSASRSYKFNWLELEAIHLALQHLVGLASQNRPCYVRQQDGYCLSEQTRELNQSSVCSGQTDSVGVPHTQLQILLSAHLRSTQRESGPVEPEGPGDLLRVVVSPGGDQVPVGPMGYYTG